MRRLLLTMMTVLLSASLAVGQSVWNAEHLARVKSEINRPFYSVAFSRLTSRADSIVNVESPSVMTKPEADASGDWHDYFSIARYAWPDPNKPVGKPYIHRDGISNPEIERYDRMRLAEMSDGVTTLALAWYFGGDMRYAVKAAEMLRTWFLDGKTRMNPNLNFAQVIPGQDGDGGRCYGIIDTYSFVEMLDAVQLLERSSALSVDEVAQLRQWFADFLQWMLTSRQGREESRQKNNHSVAYDVQVAAFARFSGRDDLFSRTVKRFCKQRLKVQVKSDGSQPHELWRTLAFGYSEYNFAHIVDMLQMACNAGMDIDGLRLAEKAADFLAPYLGQTVESWPYKQISQWKEKQNALCRDLYRISELDNGRDDLRALSEHYVVKRFSDPFFLVYYSPDSVDDAFAHADVQLRHLLGQCKASIGSSRPMPRCVEPDGRLRLVGIGDWCSGFFPGELWQMFQYSKDDFWRENAERYTGLLDSQKTNGSSHDLGFQFTCSYGKGLLIADEKAYGDVLVEAARTLTSRFDDNVGCIRSWSWGGDRWQFPVIIDNMMNLELLFDAWLLTGEARFRDVAVSHANRTLANHFRSDGSSYHVVDYNPKDGSVIKRITFQGLDDESVWSRGQAWGLYGFTMCYRYTADSAYLNQAEKIAKFFFSQSCLRADFIPYWDMCDARIPGAPLDASSAAVFASGLYELARYVDKSTARQYRQWADGIVRSLSADFQAKSLDAQGFILLHSTGNHPAGDEIDVPINYADYYYLEALLRKQGCVLSLKGK